MTAQHFKRHCHWGLALKVGGRALVLSLAVNVLLSGPQTSPVRARTAPTQPQCQPDFPFKAGWLGGDGIFSVPLSSGKTLWLFGDSFVAVQGPTATRQQASLVANSIALSHCGQKGFDLDYFWRQQGPHEAAFFTPPPPAEYKFWPIHGVEHGGKLYLALEQVKLTPGPENGFNFEIAGVTLAEIANPTAAPPQWQIRYRSLSQSKTTVPGIAMVKEGDFLYLLSVREDAGKKHPFLLHRLALADLDKDSWPLQYLSTDAQESLRWKPGLDGSDAQILATEGAMEASLHFDSQRQSWILVHTHPAFFSREIVIRQSKSLMGPWEQTVQRLPLYSEMLPQDPRYHKDTFCYAAKAHPAFSVGGELWVSYACNSLKFETLLGRSDLYRPVFKRISLPPLNQ